MSSLAASLTEQSDIRTIDFRLLGWKFGHSTLWSNILSLPSIGDLFNSIIGMFNNTDAIKKRIDDSLMSISTSSHIVVMIDDVDRLSVDEIADLARLIKSSADFKNVTYVLLADEDYISAALAEFAPKMSDSIETGRSYLEKLIPIALHVPRISSARLEEKAWLMISSLLSGLIDRPDEVLPTSKDFIRPYLINMRAVIRFFNSLKSQIYFLVDGEKRRLSIDINDFLQLTALRIFEPAFYSAIYENRSWLIEASARMDYKNRPKYSEIELRNILTSRMDDVRWKRLFGFVKDVLGWEKLTSAVKDVDSYLYSLEAQDLRYAEANFKLCSPVWFNVYFSCDMDVGDAISIEEYDSLEAVYPSVNDTIAMFEAFFKKGRLEKLLQGLYSRNPPAKKHFARTLLLALARLGDTAYWPNKGSHPPIWYKPEQSEIHDWVALTFQEVLCKTEDDADLREELAFEIAQESASCFVLVKLIENSLLIRRDRRRFITLLVRNSLIAMRDDRFWNNPKILTMYSAFKDAVLNSSEREEYIVEFRKIVKDRIREFQQLSYVLSSFITPIEGFPYSSIPVFALDFESAKQFLDIDEIMNTMREADERGFLPVEWLTILVAIEEDVKTNCSVTLSGEEVFRNAYNDKAVRKRIAERAKHPELINGILLNR